MTLQDRAESIANHQRFLARVAASGVVWGLKSAEGWATCESNEAEGVTVMPFWSDNAYARRAAKEGWAECVPTAIPFAEFVDKWLKGMDRDGLLVGTNWDAHNAGVEMEPSALAMDLEGIVAKTAGRPTTG